MTNNIATSQSVIVTVSFCQIKFTQARDNNLNTGYTVFEASKCAANWAMNKYGALLTTDEERLELEQLLDKSVLTAREENIREYLSTVEPQHMRTAVHKIIGSLMYDEKLGEAPRAILITAAREFLPGIDETWISYKFANADNQVSCAKLIVSIIKSDERFDDARKAELFECLRKEIASVSSDNEANAFIEKHTVPRQSQYRGERSSEVRQLAPTPAKQPRREPTSQPLMIAKIKDPGPKLCRINELEVSIKDLKTEAASVRKSINDRQGGKKEDLEKLEASIEEKRKILATLQSESATRKQAAEAQRKAKGKKAPAEPKKSKAA